MDEGGADFTRRLKGDEATVAPGSAGATAPLPRLEDLVRLSWPLPKIALSSDTDLPSELVVGQLLGEGGMGKVLSARQVALDREVAVKVLRAPDADPTVSSELLREALVTGQLEHPNIVPVYLLGQDEQGRPFFAMKRIEGVAWSALLADPALAQARAVHHRDALEFHLEVFRKVCDAVAFAHARGIVHRDLKPSNVMLGAFGEVYVLDWGIAVSLRDDARIPRAKDVTGLAGTPLYMAPEMAACEGSQISERTDVYLLGAILHEVLTGKAPHTGERLIDVLNHAAESQPPAFGPEVPAELAGICSRALHRVPAERYESAEALRLAVAGFLQHRQSRALQAAAEPRAAELERMVTPEGKLAPGAGNAHAQAAFAACRFGYEQALLAWPQNPEARTGLQRALERMVEYELGRQNPGAALLLVQSLPEPRPALAARVEALARELESQSVRLRELERFRKDADLNVALRARGRVAQLMTVWGPVSIAVGYAQRKGLLTFGYTGALLAIGTFNAMALMISLWLKRQPMNEASRRLITINQVGAGGFLLFWVAAAILGIPFSASLTIFMLLVASNWVTLGLLFDRRAIGVGIAFAAFGLASGVWPGAMFECFGLAVITGFGRLAVVWREPDAGPS